MRDPGHIDRVPGYPDPKVLSFSLHFLLSREIRSPRCVTKRSLVLPLRDAEVFLPQRSLAPPPR